MLTNVFCPPAWPTCPPLPLPLCQCQLHRPTTVQSLDHCPWLSGPWTVKQHSSLFSCAHYGPGCTADISNTPTDRSTDLGSKIRINHVGLFSNRFRFVETSLKSIQVKLSATKSKYLSRNLMKLWRTPT